MSLFGIGGSYDDRLAILMEAGLMPKEKPKKEGDGLPVHVRVALDFIRICNEMQGPRGFSNGKGGVKLHEARLDPKQQMAFDAACRVVRDYFDSKGSKGNEPVEEVSLRSLENGVTGDQPAIILLGISEEGRGPKDIPEAP